MNDDTLSRIITHAEQALDLAEAARSEVDASADRRFELVSEALLQLVEGLISLTRVVATSRHR
jgi:hypothetical protein